MMTIAIVIGNIKMQINDIIIIIPIPTGNFIKEVMML